MNGQFTVLVNPTANRGKANNLTSRATEAFEAHGLEAEFIEPLAPYAVDGLVRDAAAAGHAVVAMGGDGMVNMVARCLAGTDTPMGIIPCGTGNDFAESIGLPVRDPEAAVEIIAANEPRKVDVSRIKTADGSEGVSCAVISMGFDSEVSETAERINIIKGPARYTVAVFITLAKGSPARFTLTLDDGEPMELDAWLIAVGNAHRYGGGMKIAPDASVTDGILDLTVIGPISKRKFITTFPRVFKGTHVLDPDVSTHTAKKITVDADRKFLAWADGEMIGPLPAEISVEPGGLTVIAPPL
ncbi:MAG: sphingosine kinase [Acidobacteria bacterium]|nr:MAG: sphingosine kinase [Acidobacteriota bacterium]